MHFIDFLLQLIVLICWFLTALYTLIIDYILPAFGYILPILTKYIVQIFTIILRLFFTHISPCIIRAVNALTWAFSYVLNGIGVVCIAFIDSESNLVDLRAIVMCLVIISIIYFRVTQKVFYFGRECIQMTVLNVRFLIHLGNMLVTFSKYVYTTLAAFVQRKRRSVKTEKINIGRKCVNNTNGLS